MSVKTIEPLGPWGWAIQMNRCLDPANCDKKQFHLRVGNEIHHCHGGDGCECQTCIDVYWYGITRYRKEVPREQQEIGQALRDREATSKRKRKKHQ